MKIAEVNFNNYKSELFYATTIIICLIAVGSIPFLNSVYPKYMELKHTEPLSSLNILISCIFIILILKMLKNGFYGIYSNFIKKDRLKIAASTICDRILDATIIIALIKYLAPIYLVF